MAKASERRARPSRADGRATRERLVAAGIELIAERGRAAVTMVETARRAGVSRGVVHHHFAGRDDLLACIDASLEAEMLKLADGAHYFRNPYGLVLRLAVENPSIIRSRIQRILEQGPLADPRTVNLLRRLKAIEAEGALRPGVDPTAVALIAAALDFAGLMAISLASGPDEQRALTGRLSDTWREIYLHGVLARPEED